MSTESTVLGLASSNDLMHIIQPVIIVLEGYYTKTYGHIPNHYGLIELLDNAFMAYTLIEQLNGGFVENQGMLLLDIDVAAMIQDIAH